jgi:hypothetical protein
VVIRRGFKKKSAFKLGKEETRIKAEPVLLFSFNLIANECVHMKKLSL